MKFVSDLSWFLENLRIVNLDCINVENERKKGQGFFKMTLIDEL